MTPRTKLYEQLYKITKIHGLQARLKEVTQAVLQVAIRQRVPYLSPF